MEECGGRWRRVRERFMGGRHDRGRVAKSRGGEGERGREGRREMEGG